MLVSALFTVTLLQTVSASIGPIANVHIVNNYIQPDGFNRSYVLQHFSEFFLTRTFHFLLLHSAVLAGNSSTAGTFPGPLIVGTKVGHFVPGRTSS